MIDPRNTIVSLTLKPNPNSLSPRTQPMCLYLNNPTIKLWKTKLTINAPGCNVVYRRKDVISISVGLSAASSN